MARPSKPRDKHRPIEKAQAGAAPAQAKSSLRREILICAALLLVTFAVYAQVRHHDLVLYDDTDYVTDNAHVRAGLTWDGAAWAFTNNQAGNWFPLAWFSLMLDCQVFGVDSGAIHLMNVFYHALAALLLFLVLRRMTGAVWRSAFVAFLFALHPLHVESVAWVAERKDVLSALLWFLTMWVYLGYVKRPDWRRYTAVLAVFALASMSKSMVVTLPLVLLLLDFWPLRRVATVQAEPPVEKLPLRRAILEKVPLLAMSLALGVVTIAVQQSSHYVMPLGLVPLPLRVANALVSVAAYLADMCWPVRLAVFYTLNFHPPLWQPVAAGAAILAVSLLAIRFIGRRPYLAVGWFWYLVTLLPVIGLVQVGSQARADRYTYIPMVGIWIALAWGVAALVRNRPALRAAAAAAAAAACVACCALTWRQVGYWQDTVSLFQHSLSVTSGNYLGYNILGLAYRDRGDLDKAIACYQTAVQIDPAFQAAHANLSQALVEKGRTDEALNEIAIAARLRPDDEEAQYNLGAALANQGRFEDAIVAFRAAVKLKPDYAKAHANLGAALASLGRFDEAIAEFTTALRIDPGLDGVRENLEAALDARQQQTSAPER
jgi:tetratricopeptide (TPR) repeat protein